MKCRRILDDPLKLSELYAEQRFCPVAVKAWRSLVLRRPRGTIRANVPCHVNRGDALGATACHRISYQ